MWQECICVHKCVVRVYMCVVGVHMCVAGVYMCGRSAYVCGESAYVSGSSTDCVEGLLCFLWEFFFVYQGVLIFRSFSRIIVCRWISNF